MSTVATAGIACARGLPGVSEAARLPVGGAWEELFARLHAERAVSIVASAVVGEMLVATDAQRESLVIAHEAAMRSCVMLERSTLDLAETLGRTEIDFRILKGPAVAHLDYPDPSWRTFGDVDVLVRSVDYDATVEALQRCGAYRRSAEVRPGFDRRFGKGVCMVMPDGVQIDVHRSLATGPFGLTINLEDLFEGSATISLAGTPIPVLTREHRLAHACFHAALGDATPRLVALRDIAQLMLTTDVDVDATRAMCTRWRAGAVMEHAIAATWDTLDLASTSDSEWARGYAADSCERRSFAAYLGPNRSYARQMIAGIPAVAGWRAKVAYVRSLLLVDPSYAQRHGGGTGRRIRRVWRSRPRREPAS